MFTGQGKERRPFRASPRRSVQARVGACACERVIEETRTVTAGAIVPPKRGGMPGRRNVMSRRFTLVDGCLVSSSQRSDPTELSPSTQRALVNPLQCQRFLEKAIGTADDSRDPGCSTCTCA